MNLADWEISFLSHVHKWHVIFTLSSFWDSVIDTEKIRRDRFGGENQSSILDLFTLNCLFSTQWRCWVNTGCVNWEVRTEKYRFGSYKQRNKTLLLTIYQVLLFITWKHFMYFGDFCFLVFFAFSLKMKNCLLSLIFHLKTSKWTLRMYPLIHFLPLKESSSQQWHYAKQPWTGRAAHCHWHLWSVSMFCAQSPLQDAFGGEVLAHVIIALSTGNLMGNRRYT